MKGENPGKPEGAEKIEGLMRALGLGTVVGEPVRVYGGLLHKMYHIATSSGEYAVKALNPEIMKRPDALSNMARSEKIAKAFEGLVPLCAACELGGKQVQAAEGEYYLVYPWLEGAPAYGEEITPGHCGKIGDILGRIHGENLRMEGVRPEEDSFRMFPWEAYLPRAESLKDRRKWAGDYVKAYGDIRRWNKKACAAGAYLSRTQVISHRDLDPKNVLWNGGEPRVIDWEAAGYVNPFQEFLEAANYWAGDGKGGISREKFDSFAEAYRRHVDTGGVRWDEVSHGGCMGLLGWLEYNVKRALGMEVSGGEEIAEGEKQAEDSIGELYAYWRRKCF